MTMTRTEPNRLAGRCAIVTGGGRGLGQAMTLALADAGATVIATAAVGVEELEAVAKEAAGQKVVPVQADVTRPEDCARVVEMAVERCGRLDLLINNAGRGMKYVSETFL